MKRRLMVIMLSLTLVFTLIPMTAFGETVVNDEDIQEPLKVVSGQDVTVRSITVDKYGYKNALDVYAKDNDASVKVLENVSLFSEMLYAEAVSVEYKNNKASVDVGGNVTAEGATATGLSLNGDGDSPGKSTVKIGGRLSVKGRDAEGVNTSTGAHDIFIGKGITVTSTSESAYSGESARGLLDNSISPVTADIIGDIKVKAANGNAYGIIFGRGINDKMPESNVLVHGNVYSDGIGIDSILGDNACKADVLVEGTIKAKKTGVILSKGPSETTSISNTKITVWKVEPNERGNVAEVVNYAGTYQTDATDFEKNNISYIIKYKQPSKGGKIYAVNSSGNALTKSHGFRVAKEGDKIIVKANLDSGWKLKSVYDNDKALKKDDNGNFYLTVHKGGGILLSADLEAPGSDPTQMGSDGTAVGEGASAAAADQKITGMKTDTDPKGSKFNKLRLRSTYQTKTSITLKWKSNKKAEKYVIYGNRCGTSTKIRKSVKLYTVKKSTKTTMTKVIKKVKGAAVKKNTYYKFLIVALNKKNEVVSTSRMIHVATKGGKYTNYKKISIKKSVLTKAKNLNQGQRLKLYPKQIKVTKSLKARKHVPIRYESTNKTIAKVTSKGVIKALKKGSCYVYVYAQNGVYKKVRVVVK